METHSFSNEANSSLTEQIRGTFKPFAALLKIKQQRGIVAVIYTHIKGTEVNLKWA